MFVFHPQINFLTFSVCIWLWAALFPHMSVPRLWLCVRFQSYIAQV